MQNFQIYLNSLFKIKNGTFLFCLIITLGLIVSSCLPVKQNQNITNAQITLTINSNAGGSVLIAPSGFSCSSVCSDSYNSGSIVTLTANPDSGYTFSGWAGACSGNALTCTITLSSVSNVTATFNQTGSNFLLTVTTSAGGTITSSPAGINCGSTCTASYASGTSITLTETPTSGYTFSGWSGGVCSGTSTTCTVSMSAAKSVTATFAATTVNYALTVTTSAGGTVTSSPAGINCGSTCTASYASGTSITLTETPTSGYTFSGWSGGVCSGTSTTCTVSMSAAKSVTATFATTSNPGSGGNSIPTTGCGSTCLNGTALRSGAALAVKVSATGGVNNGGRFIDGVGNTIKFIGTNLAGLEYTPISGAATITEWGNQLGTSDGYPNFSYYAKWDINVVRIPLNEASWNANGANGSCVDVKNFLGHGLNATINPDPSGNYRHDVTQAVQAATAAGFFVILDLHWTAPSNFCPFDQDQMANTDNSVRFWQSVATTYKNYPNVMFELFNEPYVFGATDATLTNGTTVGTYFAGGAGGALYQGVTYNYALAGWNQLISTIRATGASNVILVGTANWSGDNTTWLANAPSDTTAPAGYVGTWTPQIAATWHTYPAYGATWGTAAYNVINNYGTVNAAKAIIAGGYPVFVTEFGDLNTSVTTAPFVSTWLPQFDAAGISYIGWAWSPPASVFGNASNQMTLDAQGTPTLGMGQVTYNHFICVATSANPLTCP